MRLREATVADIPAILAIQEPAAVVALSHLFPQDEHPFPRDILAERWSNEIAAPEVSAYVAEDDTGAIVGFAATRGNELFHFGTTLESWGSGLAQELHDEVLERLVQHPDSTVGVRLLVFEENLRARRFYEKLGWLQSDYRTYTSFTPHPVLVEYRR